MSLLLRLEALADRVGAAVCGMGPDLDVLCGAAALLIVVDAVAYVAADAGFMAFFQGRFLLSGADVFRKMAGVCSGFFILRSGKRSMIGNF